MVDAETKLAAALAMAFVPGILLGFSTVVLAEGDYRAIARNDNKVYQQDLTVIPGVDGEIEVLAR